MGKVRFMKWTRKQKSQDQDKFVLTSKCSQTHEFAGSKKPPLRQKPEYSSPISRQLDYMSQQEFDLIFSPLDETSRMLSKLKKSILTTHPS